MKLVNRGTPHMRLGRLSSIPQSDLSTTPSSFSVPRFSLASLLDSNLFVPLFNVLLV
jgi:hypothetical protein